MRRTYDNSPIVEAVCEFRFDPAPEWDLTIPGLVWERLKDDFPDRRVRPDFPVDLQEKIGQEIVNQMERMSPLMQFYSEDGSALVQIGHYLLGVSHLRPYSSWETFRAMITKGLAAYREVVHPTKLARLGLRYINRVDVSAEKTVDIKEYLNTYPVVPQVGERAAMSSWLQRAQIPYEDVNALLTLHIGSIPHGEHDRLSFMIDLDFSTQEGTAPDIDLSFEWLDNAHGQIEEMFELTITDKTRRIFEEKVKQ
jgi:uncharacterized protein (TIGR04255 family)